MTSAEFERWEKRFATPEYVFGKAPNTFLQAHAADLPKRGKALAIADGEGRNGVFLAEHGLDVLSVDFSPAAQEKARKLAAERGVSLRLEQADITQWNWPAATFDVVAAIFFQFATPAERDAIFAGIKRTLKSGGLLLLLGYGPKQLEYRTGGPDDAAQLYTRELLQESFAEFASVAIKEYDCVLQEGARHAGMSALIELVGRK
jgi:SAM-dependent methyltransferase